MLLSAGWVIQDREELNLGAGVGVAVREFHLSSGFADYLLFVNRKKVGVILKDVKYFRKAYILPALNEVLIEMTVPEKPKSRLQKYRLTENGREIKNSMKS